MIRTLIFNRNAETMMRWKGALRYRTYRIYFAGQLVSITGTWMQQVAISWLMYRLTNSATMLAASVFVQQIPILIIGLWTGSFADKWNKQKALLITQGLFFLHAASLCILTSNNLITGWNLLFFATLLGLINAFDTPLRQVFVANIIENKNDLTSAIALNSLSINGARIIGPSIAGMLLLVSNEAICFAINSASYLAIIAAILMMGKIVIPRHFEHKKSAYGQFADGFSIAMADPWIKRSLLMMIAISFFGSPYTSVMPMVAKQTFAAGADLYGLLMSCSGAGALFGGLILATTRSHIKLETLVGASAPLGGAGLFVFGTTSNSLVAAVSIFFVGLGLMLSAISTSALIQSRVVDQYRGRVMTLYSMALFGGMPLGSLLLSGLIHVAGLTVSLEICALTLFITASYIALAMQKLKNQEAKEFQNLAVT